MENNPRSSKNAQKRRGKPATTPEEEENQLISAATVLAAKQIREGTASSQVITHFLKLGSTREKLEQDRIRQENKLTEARIASLASAERLETLYAEALNAMRRYSGEKDASQD